MNKNLKRGLFLVGIPLMGIILDLATKAWSVAKLKGQAPIVLIKDILEFRYVENDAIAFSFMESIPANIRIPLIFALSGLATLMLAYMIYNWRNRKLIHVLPLLMVMGGAIGNFVDRSMNMIVRDFIFVHYGWDWTFPVFNVADMLVTSGVILLFLQVFLGKNKLDMDIKEGDELEKNTAVGDKPA